MSRWILLSGLVAISVLLGLLSTWTTTAVTAVSNDDWRELAAPDRSWQEGAINRLVVRGRWEIDAPAPTEVLRGPTGEFSSDYNLVGIVNSDEPYALLQVRHGKTQTNEVLRVQIGDVLDNDWAILEITDVAVVAKRKEETQRVELFSKT